MHERQSQRNKRRIIRERAELLSLQDKIIPEKYNVFHWPPKLDIYKLKKLNMLDAKGIKDEMLADFRQCSCGYQYSFREYRRSFRRNNMPTGAAAKNFNAFIVEWSKAKEYSEKIILIDRLLHEFHMSLISGAKNRPVAMNFIDGTRENVDKIINELAGI